MQQNDENCTEEESPKVSEKLRDFKSLIYHAREVEDGMEGLYRSLSQRHIDCKINLIHHFQQYYIQNAPTNLHWPY